jgi:hypothetical protein
MSFVSTMRDFLERLWGAFKRQEYERRRLREERLARRIDQLTEQQKVNRERLDRAARPKEDKDGTQ